MLVFCLILAPGVSLAETLRLTTVNWQPFYADNLPEKGFFSAIVREAFKRAGYEIQIEFQPWKRALESTKKGSYDGLLGVYFTEERTDFLAYSEPVLDIKDVFVAMDKKHLDYQELEELRSLSVAAVRGSLYADELNKLGFKVIESNDDLQAFRMLGRGRVDLVLSGEKHYLHLMDTEAELKQYKDSFVILTKPYATNPLFVPIRRSKENSHIIIQAFNEALSDMKQDGSFKTIIQAAGF